MKKLLALILVVVQIFAMVPVVANATEGSETETSKISLNAELSGTNNTDICIPDFTTYNGITTPANEGNFTLSGTAWIWWSGGNRYNPGYIFGPSVTSGTNLGKEGNLYDGTGATAGTTYGYAYNQGGVYNYDGSAIYTDFIYDLGDIYDISHIAVVHGASDNLMTGHYKLYASETVSSSSDFTDNELVADFVNADNIRSQVFSPTNEPVYARYVCLRVLNPIANSYADDPTTVSADWISSQPWYLQIRIAQFAVYGTLKNPPAEGETSPLKINNLLSGTNNTDTCIPSFDTYNAITRAENAEKFTLSGTAWIWYEAGKKYNPGNIFSASMMPAGPGRLYDGVGKSGGATMGYSYSQGGEFNHDGSKIYTDIIYDLGAVYDISHIAVVHGNQDSLMTGHYKLYASVDKASDFTDSELLYDYVNQDNILSQVFSPSDEAVYARYVCLRILNPVANSYAEDPSTVPESWCTTAPYYLQIRLDQFVVYGNKLPGQATITTDTLSHFAYYSGKVDLTHNLIAEKQPESIEYINADNGVTTPTAAKVSGERLTSTKGAYDGHTQGGYNQISFVKGTTTDGVFTVTELYDDETKRYVQFNYALDGVAKISDVAVFGHMQQSLSPSHFKVSFADSYDELFGNNAYTYEVENADGKQIVKLELPEDDNVVCSYFALRVICGVATGAIGGSMNEYDYYSRISHIDIHGEWLDESKAVDNLTVSADRAFIEVTKSSQQGCLDNNSVGALGTTTITATAPASAYNDGKWYTFNGWYNGETLVGDAPDYTHTLSENAVTLTAKYDEGVGYKVEFKDHSDNVLYTAYTAANTPISDEDIFNASRAVPERYGFVRSMDENNLQIWDRDVTEEVNSDVALTPLYKKSEDKYSVKVTKTDASSATEQMVFDQRIELSDANAKQWLLGDKIISYGTDVTLYVSGNMEIVASGDETTSTSGVVIMDTVKNQDTLSVLVHINNPDDKEIAEAGVVFVSGDTYDLLGDGDWTDSALVGKKYAVVRFDSITGNDYMGNLIGIPTDREVTRVAQAYVKFKDGTAVYSAATEKQVFEGGNLNPLAIYGQGTGTADPWITYHDGYYYHCYNENNNGNWAVYITKSESLFDIANPILKVKVWDNNWADDVFYSNYAPELHNIDGTWYIYTAPCQSETNQWGHDMIVYKYEGDSPLADGENTKYEKLGYIEGFPNLGNNIDGTVFHYNDKEYFIWSYYGQLYIGELTSPTVVENVTALPAPTYEWEQWIYSLNEGPAVLEHNGKYFISFAASDSQSDYYSLGLMEFAGGDPLNINNWTKWEEPVLTQNRELGIYGPGHASFTKVLVNGNWVDYVVYHASSKSVIAGEATSVWYSRDVYAQPVYWDVNGKPVFGEVGNNIYWQK